MPETRVTVIGAGLAGSEAALVLSAAGVEVRLIEMRPGTRTPAHRTGDFAELVCSNSMGSEEKTSGKGILKAELAILGSNLIRLASRARVPAGKALAVDRTAFAQAVTDAVESRENIRVVREDAISIPDDPVVVVACGPLPSPRLSEAIRETLGGEGFYFYDAISPIVSADSIVMEEAFVADRYGKGSGDYINLPLSRRDYTAFLEALLSARIVPPRDFEEERFFEGCLPVEILARRGGETLLFGPMRPVGLVDPRTGKIPYAVVQLRRENAAGTMYNIVGFQTRLAYPDQERVFGMIPGLGRAKFLRHGSVHRNTFIDARRHVLPWMESKQREGLFFAGQVTGVEGYVESIASGFVAGVSAAERAMGRAPAAFPSVSMIGALLAHITSPGPGSPQPMNANFGLLPLPLGGRKRERKARQADAALSAVARFRDTFFKFDPLVC